MKLLKINDLFKVNLLKFYQKLTNDRLPPYFDDFKLQSLGEIHSYDTRNKSVIPSIVTRTESAQDTVRNILPIILNNTDELITSKFRTHSPKGFSEYIKQSIIANYSEVCQIQNCYICRS